MRSGSDDRLKSGLHSQTLFTSPSSRPDPFYHDEFSVSDLSVFAHGKDLRWTFGLFVLFSKNVRAGTRECCYDITENSRETLLYII